MNHRTLLLLALLGCGDGASDGADDGELRIGLLLPYTGRDGSAGTNFERGVLMAVDNVNAGGGLFGKQVRDRLRGHPLQRRTWVGRRARADRQGGDRRDRP
ncbi:MAG: hypothetical protein QM778_15405 [Myxococcales bacterium]